MATQKFMVEATVNLTPDAAITRTKDRRKIKEWLNTQFYHHDNDFTLHDDGSLVGRVIKEVEIDLAQVNGTDLSAQLRRLHAMAKEALAGSLGIDAADIWQVDVLITD